MLYFYKKQLDVAVSRILSNKGQSSTIIVCIAFVVSLFLSSLNVNQGITQDALYGENTLQLYDVDLRTVNEDKASFIHINHILDNIRNEIDITFLTFAGALVSLDGQLESSKTMALIQQNFWRVTKPQLFLGKYPVESKEILISYSFWVKELNKVPLDQNIPILINDLPHVVVGVLHKEFILPPYQQVQALESVNGEVAIFKQLNFESFTGKKQLLGIAKSHLGKEATIKAIESLSEDFIVEGEHIEVEVSPLLEKLNEGSLWLKRVYAAISVLFILVTLSAIYNIFLTKSAYTESNTALRYLLGGNTNQILSIDIFEMIILVGISMLIAIPINMSLQLFIQDFSIYKISSDSLTPSVKDLFVLLLILVPSIVLLALLPKLMLNKNRLLSTIGNIGKGAVASRNSHIQSLFFNFQITASLILIGFSYVIFVNQSERLINYQNNKVSDAYAINVEFKNKSIEGSEAFLILDEILNYSQIMGYQTAVSTSSPLDLSGNSFDLTNLNGDKVAFYALSVSELYFDILGIQVSRIGYPSETGLRTSVISDKLQMQLQKNNNAFDAQFKNLGFGEVVGKVPESRIANPLLSHFIRHQNGVLYKPFEHTYKLSPADSIHVLIKHKALSNKDVEKILSKYREHLVIKKVFSISEEQYRRMQNTFVSLMVTIILVFAGIIITTIGSWSLVTFHCKSRRSEFGIKLAIGASPIVLAIEYLKKLSKSILFTVIVADLLLFIVLTFVKSIFSGYGDISFMEIFYISCGFTLIVYLSTIMPLYNYLIKDNPMKALQQVD